MSASDNNVISFMARPLHRPIQTGLTRAAPQAPLRVLIIDDTPEDRMVVRLALESQGYLLSEVDNGERGVAAATSLRPDCILLDYHLPDLDGEEVLAALRQPDGSMPCAVVMLTGSSNGENAARLLAAGALDYLSKQHLSEDSLRRAVHGAVERHRLLEERRLAAMHNAHLAAIVAASSDAIVSADLDDRVTSWNPGAVALFGYSEQETIGRTIEELILPPHMIEQRRTLSADVKAGRVAVVVDAERQRKDGTLVAVEVNTSPMFDASGAVAGISVIFRDITERKQAEAALLEAARQAEELGSMRQRLVSIVESTADAVIGFDVEGRITNWNDAAEALFGYTAEEAIGRSADLLVTPLGPPHPGESERDAFDAALAGERFQRDTVRVAKNGTVIDVNVTATQVRTPDGQILGVSAIMRDIRDRKQAERALRTSELRYRRLFEAAHDGVLLLDPDTRRIVDANPFMTRLLGYTREELIGMELYEIGFLADAQASQDMFQALRTDRQVRYENLPLRTHNGAVREVEVVANLYDEDGRSVIQGNVRDITERKRTEERLRESEWRQSFLLRLNDRLRSLDDASAISSEAARVLGEELGFARTAFYEIDKGDYVTAADYTRGVTSLVGRYPVAAYGRDFLERQSLGEPIVVPDVTRAHTQTEADLFAQHQIGAYLNVPLVRNGQFVAGLTAHSTTPRDWSSTEVEMVRDAAERTWARVERARAEARLRAAHDTFRHLVNASPFGIYVVDADFRLVQVSEGAQKVFENVRPLIGRDLAEVQRILWSEPFATEFIERFRRTLATGEPYGSSSTVAQRADTADKEAYDWKIERVMLPDGRPGVVCHFYDLSERQRHEEHIQLLMREVNHRSKNMLSLVQSIARQTAATRPEEFMERFGKRVQALAANQDLLVRSEWKAVPIDDLVRSQLAHFGNVRDTRVALEGPPVEIIASASQAMGMALHELGTNAAKYGALSNESGRVTVSWDSVTNANGERRFKMSWVETGGPPVVQPSRRGFGSTVIDGLVRMSLSCDATIEFLTTGLVWRIDCPVGMVLDGRSASSSMTRTSGAFITEPAQSVDRRRVLVVEDDALIAMEIAHALLDAGWEVVGPASTVAHALALVAKTGCDAAVLDTNLGAETAEPVAIELIRSGTPFVTVSGYSREQQPPALRGAPLIGKPLKPELLVAEISRCLG